MLMPFTEEIDSGFTMLVMAATILILVIYVIFLLNKKKKGAKNDIHKE